MEVDVFEIVVVVSGGIAVVVSGTGVDKRVVVGLLALSLCAVHAGIRERNITKIPVKNKGILNFIHNLALCFSLI
jgi:energy-converting hydrogenase Eha subunit C